MRHFLKEYFNFSKSELNGVIFFLLLIFIAIISPYIYSIFNKSTPLNYNDFDEKVEKFYADYLTQSNNDFKKKKYIKNKSKNIEFKPFYFDPNTATKKDFVKLGLSEKQIKTLLNYRNSGAKFYKTNDFKNVYGISKKQYSKLKPYIKINLEQKLKNKKNENTYKKDETKRKHKSITIELNTADTFELKKLHGIGTVLAKRIVKYREFLGGFYSTKQLEEVYGINPQTVNKISKNITIDTSFIHKLEINTLDFKTLNKHPYLSYANTKAIFKYRELMGKFTKKEQLIKNNLLDSITYFKIKHYISVK